MVASKRKTISTDHEQGRPPKKRKAASLLAKNGDQKAVRSLLKEEEPSFPRGGTSVLTPLEYKQIAIKAKKDLLFEQKTGKKHARSEPEDEENEDDDLDAMEVERELAPRKTKPKTKHKKEGKKFEEPGLRIEGLSYKVCYNGMLFSLL